MKAEDIDKRIGMPDVDEEWARFEQEVIGKEIKRHSALAWALGIGIAASVALLIIYNIGKEQTEQPLMAQVQPAQPEHVSEPARVPAKEVVAEVSKPVASPRKELALAKADAPATTGLDIPAREYGQIAGLPPIDIRRVKNDYRRTVNKQAPDTILTVVNGKEDEAFLKYLHGMPYWSRTFIYDYFFERNQLFIRQYRPEGDEINKYAHLFNGRDIRFILDYQSMPYKPVGQFTPDELKARRLAYLLRCYQEGENSRNYGGMLAPDLFDTPAEERLFGLLGVKYWQGNRFEKFGHVSRDSRGTYIPLERHMQFTAQDQIWEENGEWLGMEDDERFNAVIKELDEAANGASSSLVEPGDSIVAMAFIYGGKVAKGALHESDVMWEKPFKDKVKGSIFEFTPDEDAPSYWTAEIYYSTQFPRHMVVYLNSVDKLYATECPDILNIHYKRLTGVVQDEEGKPVGHATVGFRDRPYFSDGVSADSLGRFELMLPNHIDTIRASWVGYQTQKIRVLPTDSVLTIRLKKIDWKGLRKSEEKSPSSWKILLNSISLQQKKKASEE